eukprot:GFKZ01006045.1.p1 GENE.GFKZ01006045.1~~GFKZ01006045.1.p1  ORF type:complete len:112 (-),score=0.27 GFKZ01006045.1:66-401(-)
MYVPHPISTLVDCIDSHTPVLPGGVSVESHLQIPLQYTSRPQSVMPLLFFQTFLQCTTEPSSIYLLPQISIATPASIPGPQLHYASINDLRTPHTQFGDSIHSHNCFSALR